MSYQSSRLKDEKGVPVDTPLSPQTTAYLASAEPFIQKDIGAVILPKQGVVFGGQFYDVQVPKNMVITSVTKGQETVELTKSEMGETRTTTTPLTLSFSMDPNYKPPPVPTEPLFKIPSGDDILNALNPANWASNLSKSFGATDPLLVAKKYTSQRQRAIVYAKETGFPLDTSMKMVQQADLQQDIAKAAVATGLLSFVAAPAVAVVGAGTSIAISQGIKGVTQGELLTAEEVAYSGGLGATFGVVGGYVSGAASKAVPTLAEQGVKGAVSRVALGGGLGASGGAAISAGETAILGGSPEQIIEATGKGALYGGIAGVGISAGIEVANVATPWITRQAGKVGDYLNTRVKTQQSRFDQVTYLDDMYARVTGGQGTPIAPTKTLSFNERIRGVFRPNEAASYRKVFELPPMGTSPTEISTNWKPSTIKGDYKPTASADTFYSGGKFIPFKGGKGGLSSVLIVKQKPVVQSKTVKPFPVQTAAWTAGIVQPKTVTLKAKDISKTVFNASQTKTTLKPKTISSMTGTAELVGYNPMTYQGPEFPFNKTKKSKREISETIVLDYPASGLPQPTRIGETLAISKVSPIVSPKTEEIVKPSFESGIVTKPIFDLDLGVTPLVDTTAITDLSQDTRTQQQTVQEVTQALNQKETSKQLRQFNFEFSLPEGFKRKSRRTRSGVGKEKRVYPIITGADILDDYLGKGTKKRKKKTGHKSKKRRSKK